MSLRRFAFPTPLRVSGSRWHSQEEAHAQLDMALAAGVNFIDTAELYPVPSNNRTSRIGEHNRIK